MLARYVSETGRAQRSLQSKGSEPVAAEPVAVAE